MIQQQQQQATTQKAVKTLEITGRRLFTLLFEKTNDDSIC
jgi:hypothetical protein